MVKLAQPELTFVNILVLWLDLYILYFIMQYLFVVALIWSFSFSFIEVYLSNQVDIWFAIFIRIILALVVFLPFFKTQGMTVKQRVLLMGVGASQLGIMYFFYYRAFLYISVPEILLFKVMTPVYVTLLYDFSRYKRFRVAYLCTAFLAVCGAAIIRYNEISTDFILGFILIQCANFFFAWGQVGYKRIFEQYSIPQFQAFPWVYLGAAVIATLGWLLLGDNRGLPTLSVQWFVLVWLGVIASGVCYFLWNYGATQVDTGILAIMNNMIIPLGILVNVLVWNQNLNWPRFIGGSVLIILAILIHRFWIVRRIALTVS